MVMQKEFHFTIFAIQNFVQNTNVNSIHIVGIMFVKVNGV